MDDIKFVVSFFCADDVFVRSHPMGRRVRDRLQRGGLVEFHRGAGSSGQTEQTQVAVVLRHAVAGQQAGLGPFQVIYIYIYSV